MIAVGEGTTGTRCNGAAAFQFINWPFGPSLSVICGHELHEGPRHGYDIPQILRRGAQVVGRRGWFRVLESPHSRGSSMAVAIDGGAFVG